MSAFGFGEEDFGTVVDEDLLHPQKYSKVHFLVTFKAEQETAIDGFRKYLEDQGYEYEESRNS